MTIAPGATWLEMNQRYLSASVGVVKRALETCAQRGPMPPAADVGAAGQEPEALARAMDAPPALERVRAVFGLTPFERDTLLLCAATELDAQVASLCAAAQGDPQRAYPTFGLALAALPNPHWSALTPNAPLRRWRLVEVGAGGSLTAGPLRIDERILHELAGVPQLDDRLASLVHLLPPPEDLVGSHRILAERIANAWSRLAPGESIPYVHLCGPDFAGKWAVASTACGLVGVRLHRLYAQAIPTAPGDLEALARLWEREAVLSLSALLLDCEDLDVGDASRVNAVALFVERMTRPLIVCSRDRLPLHRRLATTFDVKKPEKSEQHEIWKLALGEQTPSLNGHVEALVAQFNLETTAIRAAGAQAIAQAREAGDDLPRLLWDACRSQSRPRLDDLAHRIEPAAGWDDLVLPEAQCATLREMAMHVRNRDRVYEQWGFATKGGRGLGISALFAGASGTGKTMAAEVLANDLHLDLHRIDLSSMVSKYIGETEKNLRRVFDAAEDGGSILLFDEADALFGKRSEVKDSHDRYANIEVSYLLQRMEAYRGLAMLTTNLKSALDTAFLRRIRFVVFFPFPDVAQRAEIWRRIFPRATPTEDLDVEKLARLNVAGGNIRNIALNAAFLAAEHAEPVRMAHLLYAARTEYAKLEKPLTESEISGWVGVAGTR